MINLKQSEFSKESMRKKLMPQSELLAGFRSELMNTNQLDIIEHLENQMKVREELANMNSEQRYRKLFRM